MCDYSLHSVASRPAKVGDKLVATDFTKSITRGFAAVGEPDVAVCLLPGTEVAFEDDVRYQHAFSLFGRARGGSQSCSVPADQHARSACPPRRARIPGWPDRAGLTTGRRTEGDCAAIAGAAYDRVGDRIREARRVRYLRIRAAAPKDGRPPREAAYYAEFTSRILEGLPACRGLVGVSRLLRCTLHFR